MKLEQDLHRVADTLFESERLELLETILQGSPYSLAYEDTELLASEDLRTLRLQLELLKPEYYSRQHNVCSTAAVFGSARQLPPDIAQIKLMALEARVDSASEVQASRARKQHEYSCY